MQRYVRVLRTRSYFERTLFPAAVVGSVAAIADFGLATVARIGAQRAPRSRELRWLADFDGAVDRLNLGRTRHAIFCTRSSAFLRWRFLRNPSNKFQIATLVDRHRELLRGYAALRFVGGTAEIADLFAPDDGELDTLLRLLVPALDQLGCEAVSFQFLGTSRIPKMLAVHGFRCRPGDRSVILAPQCRGDLDLATLLQPEAWYLTELDQDV